ncbi:hypothetical protein [Nocardia carnea]|uniref:DUF456 domain-containing protein n=1 Tax=Nocardia carnea TaxID=37328 RepID=A0ABW7TKU7_9NOCA|nr:hypothetical protein [Nocardia carnea]
MQYVIAHLQRHESSWFCGWRGVAGGLPARRRFNHEGCGPAPAGRADGEARWPNAEAPNVRPYHGVRIPDDTLSSLQWARPAPDSDYLSPVKNLHGPNPVSPVPPIAPPPGVLRFGDVRVGVPEWLPREQAIQLDDGAAVTGAQLATFLDSIGMERTRSDRVAGQTLGAAALGAAAGAAVAAPFALVGAGVGGVIGLTVGCRSRRSGSARHRWVRPTARRSWPPRSRRSGREPVPVSVPHMP